MQTPIVDEQMLAWVNLRFDNPPTKNDSDKVLRWKAAQREVVEHFKQVHFEQVNGTNVPDMTAHIKIKRDD